MTINDHQAMVSLLTVGMEAELRQYTAKERLTFLLATREVVDALLGRADLEARIDASSQEPAAVESVNISTEAFGDRLQEFAYWQNQSPIPSAQKVKERFVEIIKAFKGQFSMMDAAELNDCWAEYEATFQRLKTILNGETTSQQSSKKT